MFCVCHCCNWFKNVYGKKMKDLFVSMQSICLYRIFLLFFSFDSCILGFPHRNCILRIIHSSWRRWINRTITFFLEMPWAIDLANELVVNCHHSHFTPLPRWQWIHPLIFNWKSKWNLVHLPVVIHVECWIRVSYPFPMNRSTIDIMFTFEGKAITHSHPLSFCSRLDILKMISIE